ncbi:4-galactosyl-N-acetylglucosaminide 3-alpha-L-fucosyltransferase 9 [Lasioglossum baleicum]|uniref:4-galactosyl-N-acetylglucosaminide 3-alpha-L-fucosyltransferase 9 n=1 Tax=Lasioglossum baleicum TaxID=434251 RepID=UPI003FCE98B6
MLRTPRYIRVMLYLCIGWSIFCAIFFTFPSYLRERITKKFVAKQSEYPKEILNVTRMPRERNFSDEQIGNMTSLGRWLLSSEGSLPPPRSNAKKGPFLILIWMHGKFLERRHIKRFTNKKYSPWENCSVTECILSYRTKDIATADAVIFHLHLTKAVSDLPVRKRREQRWIFLTDESPIHTFLYGNQQISDYNGLFNWSMTYRMDSDIPVPYGRVISRSHVNVEYDRFTKDFLKNTKKKLIAVMGSNCAGTNNRWSYVSELKTILRDDLDIYGKCLKGNVTACPGHFDNDCRGLNVYKFYLAFENSNCKEYVTEKVFWNAYQKLAIPIIMGTSKKDCERLLPPHSFLHVSDFANPATLVNYVRYLDRHDEQYLEYHEWRKYYKVINEHGYFGSMSRHYCRVCEALHYNSNTSKVYENIQSFWNRNRDCIS